MRKIKVIVSETEDFAAEPQSDARLRARLISGLVALVAAVTAVVLTARKFAGWPDAPLSWASLWLPAGAALLACVSTYVYINSTRRQNEWSSPFESTSVRQSIASPERVDSAIRSAKSTAKVINGRPASPPKAAPQLRALALYIRMFTKPESVVTRISEQVEPRTASQIVKTGYTISLPEDLVGRVVLPLYRAPRGKIQDGLRFFGPQEERISSLTHAQAIAFALGVIRTLVGAASDKALADYEQWIEQDLASLMLDGIAYSDTSDPTKQSKIASVSARVGKLDNMSEFKLKAVLALVAENLSADIVCVSFDVPSTEGPLGARSVRLSVERTDPKNISPVSEVANSWSRKWTLVRLPKLRRIFGVETTIYRHSLAYAELAGSYHLSIAGPPGTYLAKQVIQPRPGVEADASGYVLSPSTAILGPRRGQRHSHAYIRNDGTRLREAEVAATFYERPPGVIMSALLSAIAASTITLLLAVQSLLPSSNGESETDLVAILLAFPAGVALWAGFKDGSRQSLAAYGSKSVTIIGSVVAAFVYLMGQGDGSDTAPIWFLIWGLLSVNACACGVSLWVRVQTSAIVQKTAALGQKE